MSTDRTQPKTDYEKDKASERRAAGCAPFVWGFIPFLLFLAFVVVFRNELAFFYYTRVF